MRGLSAIGVAGVLLLAPPAWGGDPAGFLERAGFSRTETSTQGGLAAALRAEQRLLEIRRQTDEIRRHVRRRHELRELERSGTLRDLARYQGSEHLRDESASNLEDIDRRALKRRAGSQLQQDDLQREVDRVIERQRFKQRTDRLRYRIQDRTLRESGVPSPYRSGR